MKLQSGRKETVVGGKVRSPVVISDLEYLKKTFPDYSEDVWKQAMNG